MRPVLPIRHRFWRWFYDKTAFAYDSVLTLADRLKLGSEEHIRWQVLTRLDLRPAARVLDLGCGTASSRAFLPADGVYIGLDFSRAMLRRAQAKCAARKLSAAFVQADAQALPFAAQSFELGLGMGVLQHADKPEIVINELRRTAKPGARLLLIDEHRAQARIGSAARRDNVPIQSIGEYFVIDLRV